MTAVRTDLAARMARYRPLIEAEMRRVIRPLPDGNEELYRWLRYHLGWERADGVATVGDSGKLLRSCAVLLAVELTGGSPQRAMPAAAAIELVHAFSLLHDDVEDGSTERRGRAALWTLTGTPQAINAGDGLFTLARLALYRLDELDIDPALVLATMRELDEACLRLVEGQHLDMAFESRQDVTPEEYLVMAAGKTAAMFAAAFAVGARLGGAGAPVIDAYRTFGRHAGIAFQAVDDILGIWGDPAVTGKPVGDDVRGRKRTYPVVSAIAAGGEAGRALAAAYQAPIQDDDAVTIATLVEAAGGRASTLRLAVREVTAGLAALAAAGVTEEARHTLEAFAEALVGRTR